VQLAMTPEPASAATGLEQMFHAHSRLVFRTAYRVTGNAADAEDVLQTVFLRVSRRDTTSAAMANEESYLRRAAVNAALDLVRSRVSAKNVPLDEAPQNELAGPVKADSVELKQCLRKALATLNRRDAEVFWLRFFEERPNAEIARLLGITQVHVAVMLHRVRRQLQKEIRSYMGGRS